MKAKLEFDLDNPDDKVAHLRCVKSDDIYVVLFDFLHNARKRIEYTLESKNLKPDWYYGVEETFDELQRLLDEYNVNINELT